MPNSPAAAKKGLELAYEVDEELPPAVNGDQGRLRQILLNLLSNAVKFTEQGEVKLIVKLLWIEGGRVSLHFEVRDTGMGMAAAKVSKKKNRTRA